MSDYKKCLICSERVVFVFKMIILKKYTVSYFYCDNCGFLKTEKPYWLNEAYQDAISDSDTGIVKRNIENSKRLIPFLNGICNPSGEFVDISGGYGLLTRLLRDKGFNCFSTDKYCQNIFAKDFEPEDGMKADCLFAFEVLEHIDNAASFFKEYFNKFKCKTVIFTTETFDGAPPFMDWWYYSFETGQHISFYQKRTLQEIAELLGCKYYRISNCWHLITDKVLPLYMKQVLLNKYLRLIYSIWLKICCKRNSKTLEDNYLILQKQKIGNVKNNIS